MVRTSEIAKIPMEINDAESVILGMLHDGPQYGYELDKSMEQQSIRDWTEIGFSSIYYTLGKLEKKQFVTSKLEATEKHQTRKIYAITQLGINAIHECVKEKIRNVKLTKWSFDIGLAFLNILPSTEIIEHLQQYRENLVKTVVCYNNLKQYLSDNECPINRLQLAERPIILYQAEIQWVDQFISELQKEVN